MNQDQFVKVFDILDSGFKNWPFAGFGLIAVAVGLCVAALPYVLRRLGIPFAMFQSRARFAFSRYFPLAFGVLWTLAAFAITFSQYQQHVVLAREGTCRLIEGRVEQFQPKMPSTPGLESFVVSGVRFSYTDAAVNDGFNDTAANGGPIREGEYVRICYDPRGNVILRLEIRGFTGEVKDYSRPRDFFFSGAASDAPRVPRIESFAALQWIGQLIWVMMLADFGLIAVMYRPYLKTFPRLRRIATGEIDIPAAVQPDTKIKLRDTLLYWDRSQRTAWLRPRGYNLIQVPSTVAKLNLSQDERAVVSGEIRLSWALPAVIVIFVVMAYVMFSSMPMAAGAQPVPLPVMLIFGAMIVGFFCFALVMVVRRMGRLMREALEEIAEGAPVAPRRGP